MKNQTYFRQIYQECFK